MRMSVGILSRNCVCRHRGAHDGQVRVGVRSVLIQFHDQLGALQQRPADENIEAGQTLPRRRIRPVSSRRIGHHRTPPFLEHLGQ